MANLSLSNAEAYCRAYCTELDNGKITSGEILVWGTLGQRKVQTDLMALGIKKFVKTAYNTGAEFTAPADILNVPNAIIDMTAGTGSARASFTKNYTSPTANLTHTALQPGTPGNNISITLDAGTFGSPSSGVQCVLSGGAFFLDFFNPGQTCAAIAAAFNADPVYSQYMVCSTTTPAASPVPSSGTAVNLAGGAGSGFYPAREISHEDYLRVANNFYLAPSATDPAYCLYGVQTGIRTIRFLPNTVTYSLLTYQYRVPDLTTGGNLGVPEEHEELVLIQIITKMFDKLEMTAKKKEWEIKYEEKKKELVDSYQRTIASQSQNKQAMQSTDIHQ
jgi:hypothetical protein